MSMPGLTLHAAVLLPVSHMYTKCENDCVSEKIRMPKIIEYKDGSRQMLVANIIFVANMPMTCRFLLFFFFM